MYHLYELNQRLTNHKILESTRLKRIESAALENTSGASKIGAMKALEESLAIQSNVHSQLSDFMGIQSPSLTIEQRHSMSSASSFTGELSSFSKRLQARLQRTGSWASRSSYHTAETRQTQGSDITYRTVNSHASSIGAYNHPIGPDTRWQAHLRLEGFDPSPSSVVDWSGRGQHVEYLTGEQVPLEAVELLGQGGAAYVESVKCRRILLARKSMRCSVQSKREECIREAKLLDKLRHPHIVQLVGTYIQGNTLAILMYPVANCGSLDAFLEQSGSLPREGHYDVEPSDRRFIDLAKFPKCLAGALRFIHGHNVKHLDIKPKNILVRGVSVGVEYYYRPYITDFGISRSYGDEADIETNSPVPFTRTYCAPEVARQDTRGRTADIYSLGCVFVEIYTVICGKTVQALTLNRGGPYHQNYTNIRLWLNYLEVQDTQVDPYVRYTVSSTYRRELGSLLLEMLQEEPSARVALATIIEELVQWKVPGSDWRCCEMPPERYECHNESFDTVSD